MALAPMLVVKFNGEQLYSTSHRVSGKKWIPVSFFEHRIKSKGYPLEGRPSKALTGEREHDVFVIRKKVDVTSPYFYELMLNSDLQAGTNDRSKLSAFELMLADTKPTNPPKPQNLYGTIILRGAVVVSIESVMPDYGDQAERSIHEYEEIWFAYDEIVFNFATKVDEPTSAGSSGKRFAPDWYNEAIRVEVYEGLAKLDKK
ncbi:MAG: type VI secretion system tube protein Hcp [Kofleriaceae bacterium]|nr:type VI secretion system tube protein Hcp [Kofleriaceae bacterium]